MQKITLVLDVKCLRGFEKIIFNIVSKITEGRLGASIIQYFVDLKGGNKKEDITGKKRDKNYKKGIMIQKEKQSFHIRVIPKRGQESMKLQVEIEDINIGDVINHVIIKEKNKEMKKEKAQKREMKAILPMLEALNQAVDDQEKIKLFQIILEWINRNNLLNTALQEYIASYKELKSEGDGNKTIDILAKMKLELGNISLELDEKI